MSALAPSAWSQLLPQIKVSPDKVAADSGDLKLTVSGENFSPQLRVAWNGEPRETEFVDVLTLRATIPASDLAAPGLALVSVASESGAVVSDSAVFLVYLGLWNRGLTYSTPNGKLYVSVSVRDPNGPSVAVVDPGTGTVDRFIPLSGEPRALAVSGDDRYLYVAVDTRLNRIDLTGAEADLDIPRPAAAEDRAFVQDIIVLPERNTSAIVLWANEVAGVLDGGQFRPRTERLDCLAGVQDSSVLYASWSGMLYRVPINVDGLGVRQTLLDVGQASCPTYADGLIYSGLGHVFDPSRSELLGTFATTGIIRPAPERNRVYILDENSVPAPGPYEPLRISEFEGDTLRLLHSWALPATVAAFHRRLARWGSDGIAIPEYPDQFDYLLSPWIYIVRFPTDQ